MPRTINIKKGDNLSSIANREKTTVPELLKLNPNIKNPNLIFEGASLNLPDIALTPGVSPTVSRSAAASPTIESQVSGPSAIADVVGERAGEKSSRDQLLERLTGALDVAGSFDPTQRRQELEAERGIGSQREVVSSFEEEISKTLGFLDNLEDDIKKRTEDFVVSEPQRRRLLASEANPLFKSLGIAERGLSTAESRLAREEGVVSDILSGEEKASTRGLDFLETELGLRSNIDTLTEDEEQSSREAAIVDLIDQGIEDPLQLFDLLNFDEEGNRIGDIGINEIQGVFESLQPKERNTQVITTDGRNVLIDTQTGETIADLGEDLASRYTDAQIRKINAEINKLETETNSSIEDSGVNQIIQELPAAGERDQARAGVAVFSNANRIVKLLDSGVDTGPIVGRSQSIGSRLPGGVSEDFNELQAAMTLFTANFIKSISGAQVSDNERKFLMKALPDPNKQENKNKAGIKILLDFSADRLKTYGIDPANFPDEIPDPFVGQLIDDELEKDFESGNYIEE